MKKYLIIDSRMRKIEKEKLIKLGYELIKLNKNNSVYEEISSHVDIFCTKIKDKIILEKSVYEKISNSINNDNTFLGQAILGKEYPLDVFFNVCNIGNYAIHNFKYTDKVILKIIEENKLEKIQISQGYSNCSIAVIDDNSCIVTDKKICEILKKHDIDVLFLDYDLDIKLLNKDNYSSMRGFIGGAISRLGDNIIVFGDLNKIDKENKIREFINSKGKNIISFKDLDVIDYGGVLEV